MIKQKATQPDPIGATLLLFRQMVLTNHSHAKSIYTTLQNTEFRAKLKYKKLDIGTVRVAQIDIGLIKAIKELDSFVHLSIPFINGICQEYRINRHFKIPEIEELLEDIYAEFEYVTGIDLENLEEQTELL